MEDVNIAQIYLGDKPPLIHKVSQPLMDERGTWIDADVTYEGLMHMTITTKLNLLRLKRQQQNSGEQIIDFSELASKQFFYSPESDWEIVCRLVLALKINKLSSINIFK